MDLTLPAGEFILNIRVHIIMETTNGYLFFKSKNGHYSLVGGRVKAGETSLNAAQRELGEETGIRLDLEKFKLISMVENFYTYNNSGAQTKFQEIGFVYLVKEKIEFIDPRFTEEFALIEIPRLDLDKYSILPAPIKALILEERVETFTHLLVNN